ncbi:MAG: rhomboid family intramembrane serine protease [Nanoarchaeota archaeon]
MKLKSVVMPLILINVAMFVLQLVLGNWFTNFFMLSPGDVLYRPYILLTSMFLHSPFSMNHIFWNMYGLLMFGQLLEDRIGPKRFLLLYLAAGLFSGIGHVVLSILIYGTAPSALGASGAIMGMLGALIILMPDLRLLFFFVIPMSLRTAGIIWILLDVFGIFVPSGIGNLAHLVGMATGLLYGLYLKKQKSKFNKRFQTRVHISSRDFKDYINNGKI